MKFISVLVALFVGFAVADGITSAISPEATAPAGCDASYDGNFEITVAKVEGAAKRDVSTIAKRDTCSGDGILVAKLADGAITDASGRTGYIASNFQFQFDGPPQAGAIYTSGFSTCGNGSLALGGSAVWYECASGDFYNLYDRNWAAQCSAVEILVMPCGTASETGDGQVVGTKIVTTTIVSALSDGQPQVKTTTTGVPVCQVSQINDGQVQVGTTPCASITTTAAATSVPVPVSQYSDGQIQVTPPASVPTVTSAPATESTSVAVGTSPAESGSSSIVLPSETLPASGSAGPSGSETGATGSETGATGTTLATSTASGSGATSGTSATSAEASGTSSAAASGTSAPASSGAGSVRMGSTAALMVGLLVAVLVL